MASYAIKEMFLTLQGEGLQAGRRAVFIRFTGCNLWSGREEDRATADCTFCDTDFVGMNGDNGGRYGDAAAVAARAAELWAAGLEQEAPRALAVLTGGEPLLQVDAGLIDALHAARFDIAIETNGTLPVPEGIDWICVSPKAGTTIVQRTGNELKLVWPQPGIDHRAMEGWDFDHLLVQPMDGSLPVDTQAATIRFVMANPRWRLSVQTHKVVGLR
ncbi:MAG: organic radical activating-like protein [Sphingomonas bacterium]|jgi:7-carboxy-7-deazaguanine synthase|nr:7-carboxy-7-deazaguanine synthase [Sphingomonas bacterium]MDB5689272.1 organic radical activating-like protein [Sphingomonas bacterium]